VKGRVSLDGCQNPVVSDESSPCPCESGIPLERCCAPILAGERPAPTAERLMRSRFTAFALRDEHHLLQSWHPSTRPGEVRFPLGRRWTRLEVLATVAGGLLDDEGAVEFRAHFDQGGRPGALHELSRFVRDDRRRWTYVGAVDAELDGSA
jgi:SEC-C motif domain protein